MNQAPCISPEKLSFELAGIGFALKEKHPSVLEFERAGVLVSVDVSDALLRVSGQDRDAVQDVVQTAAYLLGYNLQNIELPESAIGTYEAEPDALIVLEPHEYNLAVVGITRFEDNIAEPGEEPIDANVGGYDWRIVSPDGAVVDRGALYDDIYGALTKGRAERALTEAVQVSESAIALKGESLVTLGKVSHAVIDPDSGQRTCSAEVKIGDQPPVRAHFILGADNVVECLEAASAGKLMGAIAALPAAKVESAVKLIAHEVNKGLTVDAERRAPAKRQNEGR